MGSPDIFRSSPIQDSRRERLEIESSSPDLPPLQDILSQGLSRPPLRSGSKVAPILDDVPTAFISARNLLESTERVAEAHPTGQHGHSIPEPTNEPEHEESIIEILPETPKSAAKSQVRKGKKKESSGAKKARSKSKSTEAGKVRKQPRPKVKKDESEDGQEAIKSKVKSVETKRTKSKICEATKVLNDANEVATLDQVPRLATPITEEPLNLEPANTRKITWTPPAQKTVISLDSDSSALKQVGSPGSAQQTTIFRDLVQGYYCAHEAMEAVSAPSDEDSGFLKKRKRIELVPMNDVSVPTPEVPEKSPPKKKAPKKKARTITELATAAYRKPNQPDDSMSSASILGHFAAKNADPTTESTGPTKKAKAKANSRKKPPKPSKKKAPPKPILLSPGAALDQVAKQHFVFGTSSQLAREPSPAVLKDIQAALRRPNQPDSTDFAIQINSDDIELPEQRPRLWDAAARDADGDLFDIEVVNLAERSPPMTTTNGETDPFGYVRGEDQNELPIIPVEVAIAEDPDSFVNLSDILPSPGPKPGPVDGTPCFSERGPSTSSNIFEQGNQNVEASSQFTNSHATQPNRPHPESDPTSLPIRPEYEFFTDVQLAKEIKTYGFKPVKRRNAMIALLDQCWQSKVRLGHAGLHTSASKASTTSTSKRPTGPGLVLNTSQGRLGRPRRNIPTSTEPQDPSSSALSEKRPRGRPRKNSVGSPEPQEPPPSAQPPETPKRSRGRPRKNSASPSLTPSSCSGTTFVSPKKPVASLGSGRRKKAGIASVIEIPDSASDGSDFGSSASSTVEEMFSSPSPIDMSLSTTDDNELSLAASPNGQQMLLFEHITKAIKSAPRTTDPANPSWYEKILLYDPIVLEDLAAWLNSGQLSRVGFDEEISPGEVKKWCESKSICSVWRVNLRGKERKRL